MIQYGHLENEEIFENKGKYIGKLYELIPFSVKEEEKDYGFILDVTSAKVGAINVVYLSKNHIREQYLFHVGFGERFREVKK